MGIPSLKLTVRHMKNGWLEADPFLSGTQKAYFQVLLLLVSRSVTGVEITLYL